MSDLIKDGKSYNKVYSSSLLRIGDEVVMLMDKEARYWGRKGLPDGSIGRVVGFYEYYTTVNHGDGNKKPGIYRGNGAAFVLWEDGSVDTHGSDVAIPEDLYELRLGDTEYKKYADMQVKVFDLPKFEYMVGNVIEVSRYPGERCTIRKIEFTDIMNLRTGEFIPFRKWEDDNLIEVELESGGSTRVPFSGITRIVEQGNYWAWVNDRDQLRFEDLRSECAFFASLGMSTQVVNPTSGNYRWEIPQLIEAVRKGEIDLISTSCALFGATPFPTAYRLDDNLSDLKERARAEILKGFEEENRGTC